MKFSASLVSAAVFVAGAMAQGTVMINTPENVVECQPTLLTFSGGVPPYILSVLPGNQPSAPALEQYTGITGTSFTWNANIQGNTQVGLTLRDSTGASGQSAPFPVNPGPDASCLAASSGGAASGGTSTPPATSGSSTTSGGTTTPASTPSTTPASTPPATSTPSSTHSSTPSTSGTGSTSPAPSPTQPSAADTLSVSWGVAGLVGAAIAAIMA